jgi:hypothetical protein
MMCIQIVSLVARAIKGLFKRSQESAVVTHYSGYRWCDSTERALNEQLMDGAAGPKIAFEAGK